MEMEKVGGTTQESKGEPKGEGETMANNKKGKGNLAKRIQGTAAALPKPIKIVATVLLGGGALLAAGRLGYMAGQSSGGSSSDTVFPDGTGYSGEGEDSWETSEVIENE